MARSRGLVEIKELVQVFTKEMVRGKTLNAVLPGGRVVDVTCSLSRMLDTLTIQRGSEARDIPLADVEELLVGSECRGDEGGPPTSELLVAFALETGEQIIFSFPDTAARDTFAIFFHSRAECFDQPARAAAPPSAAAAPAATAAAAPSPAPAAVPAEVLRPELLGEEHREEGGGGRDWRALDGLESEDSASPAASQASPGASPKARPPPDKALVQAFTKEMVRGKRFSARLPGGCEEDVTCVLSRALDALTVQGAEAREIKLASVEGVLVGNHCNQDTSDPCCANLSVDLSLESGERFTFRFPDAAARDLFATCFQTFARAAAGAKPRDSAGPPASCGSLGVGASQELRPASPSEEVLRPGSSSEEAREGGAAPEELSPSRGGVASVGDGAEAAAEEPGAAAAAGESGGGQLLDSAAAVEEARRQADERLKQALEEAAAERAQAVEEARREALEAAQREAAAEMARLVEKARQEALQELQREAEENMAAERTEAIERAKREALEEVEREATKKAAAVAQSRRDAMRQGPCNHDTMELTPEFMDRLLAHMEEALERIEATSKPGSGSTVGLVRAELEFLSRAELARDFTNAVLRKEAPNSSGGGSRSGLFQTVFGGHGCRRISQLRAILEGAAISKANGGERRLAACTSVCESVERVLQDAGLGEAMRQALALESEARLQRARLPNAPSAAAAR